MHGFSPYYHWNTETLSVFFPLGCSLSFLLPNLALKPVKACSVHFWVVDTPQPLPSAFHVRHGSYCKRKCKLAIIVIACSINCTPKLTSNLKQNIAYSFQWSTSIYSKTICGYNLVDIRPSQAECCPSSNCCHKYENTQFSLYAVALQYSFTGANTCQAPQAQ